MASSGDWAHLEADGDSGEHDINQDGQWSRTIRRCKDLRTGKSQQWGPFSLGANSAHSKVTKQSHREFWYPQYTVSRPLLNFGVLKMIKLQVKRTSMWTPRGKERVGRIGIDIYTPLILCVKLITSENLLYNTGESTQHSVVT